ncbi:hypothetical protein FYK55_09635 [Roseiconus nitratireducens]|uniref:General secretion pathway protein GspK n=1 Tax=Roseiconus nitratireducens TaxID=2605748 RepID=A0A5M6DDT9_9BACT|nr:hypothetical protein [Roseiconus nitratireducens]KAA5544570.1 hypothetical protein FYK55_09635 [Roseiconus nitratireducens]
MNRANQRRGALMFCVLACLLIVGSLVAWILRDALRARRETKIRVQLQQTERLLDAGILRAVKQQQKDPNYEGEQWKPKIEFGGRPVPANIDISVANEQLTVVASLGAQPHRTRKSHSFSLSPTP